MSGQCHFGVVIIVGFLLTSSLIASAGTMAAKSVRVGDTLYISSAGNKDSKTGEQPEGIEASTKQVLANLKGRLAEHGFTLAEVVSSEVWINDLSKFGDMNKVYRDAFSGDFPTRTTVEVSALPHGSPIEIAMIAIKGNRRIVHPKGGKSLGLPFSPGILINDKLFISGQASVDPQSNKLVEGNFEAHVVQTLKNIESILHAAEMNFSDVVQSSVFLISADDFGPMSEVYRKFVPEPRPARVPFGASRLPMNAPVEITMLASSLKGKAVLPQGMPPTENYSRGFLIGNELYVSGIGSAKESVSERVDDCMERVKKIVEAASLSMDNMVIARIYLSDIDDLDAVTARYLEYFSIGKAPSQAIVSAPNLPAGLKIMMSFVATKERR